MCDEECVMRSILNEKFNFTFCVLITHLTLHIYLMLQSMGSRPLLFKYSFALLKCLHPKKPRYADKGLGCGAVKIRWPRFLATSSCFLMAKLPQSKNTRFSRVSDRRLMMVSVNCCQPIPAWLAAMWARTVSDAFSKRIPW